MYILIDCTNYSILARNPNYRILANLAYIEYANIDTYIFLECEGKSYSVFNRDQLILLLASVSSLPQNYGNLDYSEIWKCIKTALQSNSFLVVDHNFDKIETQAQCINYSDDKPYRYNPEGFKPRQSNCWVTPPHINRSRLCRSKNKTFLACASSSGNATIATQHQTFQPQTGYNIMAKKANGNGSAEHTEAPAPKAVRPRGVERIEQNGVKRPSAGGKCAAVWDIADNLSAEQKKPAEIAEIMEVAKVQGLNENNVRVEFAQWRKFNGLVKARPEPATPRKPRTKKETAPAEATA